MSVAAEIQTTAQIKNSVHPSITAYTMQGGRGLESLHTHIFTYGNLVLPIKFAYFWTEGGNPHRHVENMQIAVLTTT